MNKRSTLTLVGFLVFAFGFLALVLSLVNLQLSFLSFIDRPGKTFGLVIRLVMIFGGIIILYVSRTNSNIDDDHHGSY